MKIKTVKILKSTNSLWWDDVVNIEDPYGFIYITTNLVNGKKYIGQKTFTKYTWKNYLGSGVGLQKGVLKYGKENFHREIVSIATSEYQLNRLEKEWIDLHDAVRSESYYNQVAGGRFFSDVKVEADNKKMLEEFFLLYIDDYDWELMKKSDPNLSDQ